MRAAEPGRQTNRFLGLGKRSVLAALGEPELGEACSHGPTVRILADRSVQALLGADEVERCLTGIGLTDQSGDRCRVARYRLVG